MKPLTPRRPGREAFTFTFQSYAVHCRSEYGHSPRTRAKLTKRCIPKLITAEYRDRQSVPRAACSSTTTRMPGAGRWPRCIRCVRNRMHPCPTPVTWEEVEQGIQTEDFRIDNMPARVSEIGDSGIRWFRSESGRFKLETVVMSLPILTRPFPPMEAVSVSDSRQARTGNTNQNGTAFVALAFQGRRQILHCNPKRASRSADTSRRSLKRCSG